MMKVTLYTTDSACEQLAEAEFYHLTMFDQSKLSLKFPSHTDEQQIKFIKALLKAYVTFECEGDTVRIDTKQYQRVRFRFDSK